MKSSLLWWIIGTALSLPPLCARAAEEDLLHQLQRAPSLEAANPILKTLYHRLTEGEFYTRELEIALILRRFWGAPVAEAQQLRWIVAIYSTLAPMLYVHQPQLADTLFLLQPLQWLEAHRPAYTATAIQVLWWHTQTLMEQVATRRSPAFRQRLLRTLVPLLNEPELAPQVADILGWIAQTPGKFPPTLLPHLLQLRTAATVRTFVPLLASDTSVRGTALLIKLLEDPHIADKIPNSFPKHFIYQQILQHLVGRPLTAEQQLRILRKLRDPHLSPFIPPVLLSWDTLLVTPDPEIARLLLEHPEPRVCAIGAHFLAQAGRQGLLILFHHWRHARTSCQWEVEQILLHAARPIADTILAAFRHHPDESLLRLIAALQRWDILGETILTPPTATIQSAALRLLTQAIRNDPTHPSLQPWIDRLRSDHRRWIRAEITRALLASGDPQLWAQVTQQLRSPQRMQRKEALALLENLSLPDTVLSALLALIRSDPDPAVRAHAIVVLTAHIRSHDTAAAPPETLESTLRSALADPDADVRRQAAAFFALFPAHRETTIAALLDRLEDSSNYVRDQAAMALAAVPDFPGHFLPRFTHRLQQGDADPNVARKLEQAYLHFLRTTPAGVQTLLDIILNHFGPDRWRRALAEGPPCSPAVIQRLLDLLAQVPPQQWIPSPPSSFSLADIIAAETTPTSWDILRRCIPDSTFDRWIASHLLSRSDLPINTRLFLFLDLNALSFPAPRYRELGKALLLTGFQQQAKPALLGSLINLLGFDALRTLIDTLWDQPEQLRSVASLLADATDHLPPMAIEDLPWFVDKLRSLPPAQWDPRLEPLLFLANPTQMNLNLRTLRAIWQHGLPSLLHQYLQQPRTCEIVALTIAALHRRHPPPKCPG